MLANASGMPNGIDEPQYSILLTVMKHGTLRDKLLHGSGNLSVAVSERAERHERQRAFAHRHFELKELEDNTTLAWSLPRRRNCSLRFLQQKLYAYSFLPGDDAILLQHWLMHYIDGIGVLPSNLHFGAIQVDEACRSALKRAGINVRTQLTTGNLGHGVYTDSMRLAAVNNWLLTLPKDAWVVFADADEFFMYPCDMAKRMGIGEASSVFRHSQPDHYCAEMVSKHKAHACVCCSARVALNYHELPRRSMPRLHVLVDPCVSQVDRLAVSGRIEPLRPSPPDISIQFPRVCLLRQLLSGDGGGKFTTHKVARRLLHVHVHVHVPHDISTHICSNCAMRARNYMCTRT